MSFPTISSPTITSFGTSTTSMAVSLPSSISAGDLLVAVSEIRYPGLMLPSSYSINNYYMNGSTSMSDPTSVWSDDSNAIDGSTATNASSSTYGSSNYLEISGTNSPTSGDNIFQVRARAYMNGAWTSYVVLTEPPGGWNFTTLNTILSRTYARTLPVDSILTVFYESTGIISLGQVQASGTGGTNTLSKIELQVTTAPGWEPLFTKADGTGQLTGIQKIADGTEGSSTTFTAAVSTTGTWNVRKVSGWHGTSLPYVQTSSSNGTTNLAPDPPSVTAPWGATDNLFIEYVGTTAETITGMVGLLNHTPNTGTGWNLIWRGSTNLYTAINSSNQGQVPISIANQGIILEADATYSSADYSVEVVVSAGFTTTNRGFLIARMTDQENMYAFRFSTGATASRLYKKVSGTWTALGSGLIADPAVGDTVKLDITGTTLTVYYNGVSKQTATDSALSSAGKAGLAFGGGSELVASTDDTNVATRFDSYKVILGGSTIFEDTFTLSSSEYGSEGYSDGSFNAIATGGSACSIASAIKTSTSATEDPSEFPHSNTRYWQAATVVIRPSSGVLPRRIFVIS